MEEIDSKLSSRMLQIIQRTKNMGACTCVVYGLAGVTSKYT